VPTDPETGEAARKEFAIKVYKTSILVFRDRDRYVNGEFRFRKV
jgi:RIO kinase 1